MTVYEIVKFFSVLLKDTLNAFEDLKKKKKCMK